jgi:hypothetical protein
MYSTANTYYLGTINEYTSFQTRRKYILSRLVKKVPLFDGLKRCVFLASVQLVSYDHQVLLVEIRHLYWPPLERKKAPSHGRPGQQNYVNT